jgi:hypothetical protein
MNISRLVGIRCARMRMVCSRERGNVRFRGVRRFIQWVERLICGASVVLGFMLTIHVGAVSHVCKIFTTTTAQHHYHDPSSRL